MSNRYCPVFQVCFYSYHVVVYCNKAHVTWTNLYMNYLYIINVVVFHSNRLKIASSKLR